MHFDKLRGLIKKNEKLAKVGRQIADTGLWRMCVGGGVGVATSDQLHLLPRAFPFHVSRLGSG